MFYAVLIGSASFYLGLEPGCSWPILARPDLLKTEKNATHWCSKGWTHLKNNPSPAIPNRRSGIECIECIEFELLPQRLLTRILILLICFKFKYICIQNRTNTSQSNYIDYINHFIIGLNQAWDLWLGMVEICADPILEKWICKFAFEASRRMSFPHRKVTVARAPAATAAEKSCCLKMSKDCQKRSNRKTQTAWPSMPSRITQANWCNVFPNCCFLMLEQCASFPRFETEERVLTSWLTCLQARWRLDGLHMIACYKRRPFLTPSTQ